MIKVPESVLPRVVVIGGGFAGLELLKNLDGKKVQTVLLDKNNYHTFQPLLYQVATSGLEPDSIAFPLRKLLKNNKNCYFRNYEVKNINSEKFFIETDMGNIEYDYLVIATGSMCNFFGNKSIEEKGMPMYSLLEALDLRSKILQNFEYALLKENKEERQSYLNFAIVGGGPTGVELAGAIAELRNHVLQADYPELDIKEMNIYLLEGAEKVLPPMAEVSSRKSKEYLERLGVEVRLETMVEEYDGETIETNKGNISAKTLIWTAGVKGCSPMGIDASKFSKTNRILVDETNNVKGYENIFAIGDVAQMKTEKHPQGHPMLAQVAMQQGAHLAKNISMLIDNEEPLPFRYKNKGTMATIGRNKAVVELPKYKTQGMFAWFIWMGVHLFSLIGTRNKMVTFINWVWNYINYDRGERLIIRKSYKP